MFKMKFSLLFSLFVITLSQLQSVSARPKSWREGPIVDPGVFVITQIKECRNRMGYCILGTSCSVDSDFVKDDMGGHCNRLSEAFSPRATFVCCKQNPALFENDLEADILDLNLSHNTSVSATGKLIIWPEVANQISLCLQRRREMRRKSILRTKTRRIQDQALSQP